ncbi:beta-ketoacyl synthase N-terminal-like domain-containing protein [Streptomyces sp. NPDC053431]|uniref:beta-ketoacyl synthase N-terminal-like domain-containing protein n=1 Tax=Streptomyces sp. NPDC053431 TaxID=3365703 RepID=UPI0037D1B414
MTSPIHPTTEIAIVGMAGRFPGADSVAELWQLLLEGREAVQPLDPDQLRAAGVPEPLLSDPAYVPYGASVSGMKYFDAGFFGMTPAEAASTDPQHRLYMELAWRALEDGGVPPGGNVGVFASTGYADYLVQNLIPAKNLGGDIPYSVRIGNQADFLPSRMCHLLNFTGPSVAVQTACSSSLVAVDAACTALTLGRCDAAVTGAVALRLPQPAGYVYSDGGVWSKDGHCRPFDADASGWVAGNGGGVVVLKRLADAVADRDRIYAVIRGVGVNNDGADKTSFTAPSTSAQVAVINRAIADARIPTSQIGYVEAHGSGTPLGDPLEVTALVKAYTAAGGLAPGCGLGGIKANLGHMASAAGIASLIKTALILHHQAIPPQINCSQPNPLLQLDSAGLVLHDRPHTPATPLQAAAVTSLGMGGTNAHMILTATPPPTPRPAPNDADYPLFLSARNQADLHESAENLYRHLLTHDVRIDDLAYTLARGRARFNTATLLRARTIGQAQEALRRYLAQPTAPTASQDDGISEDALPHAVKIPLPGYPLHPEPHWISPPTTTTAAAPSGTTQGPSSDQQPVGNLQDQVVEIFRTYLGRDDLGPDDGFDTVGGSSLTAVEIVDAIADRLGPAIGLGRFVQLQTPRRVTEEIRTWVSGNLLDPSLIQLRAGTPGEEIFFIYPVNGTVFCYHKLIQNTTFAKPAYVLAYPFDDPNPPGTIADMAAKCIAEIQTVAPHGPYRLAGYSMGGNLAIEMAHQLQKFGETVTDIVMIDPLPLYAYPRPAIEIDYIRAAELTLSYFLNLPVRPSDAKTVDDVVASLRQPTWSHRTEETTHRFVSTLVSNAMAITTADQPPPIRADLTVLAATDRNNPVYDLVGIKNFPPETWQQHTTGKLTVVPLPGNHYTLYTDPENFTRLTTAIDQIYGGPASRHPAR